MAVPLPVPLPHIPADLARGPLRAGDGHPAAQRRVARRGRAPGDGRGVVLIPGFLAGDGSLGIMTHWLRGRLPHASAPGSARTWTARRPPAPASRSAWRRWPTATAASTIIGQSRGGIFARALAVQRPDLVAGIVTLGSPLRRHARRPPGRARADRLVGALGSLTRARHCCPGAACAASAATRFRDGAGASRSRADVGYVAVYSATTGSSTGAPAWTRTPASTSRSTPRTAA